MIFSVEIPRPGRLLSPNSVRRVQWFHAQKSRQASRSRTDAKFATIEAAMACGLAMPIRPAGRIDISIEWRLGFRERAMDDDNAIAALKWARDGIAEALGVNDKLFRVDGLEFVRDRARAGTVLVTLEWQ